MTVNVLGRRLPATATYAVALGAALIALIVTVSAAFWQTGETARVNQEVRETSDRRGHYRLVLIALQNAETGQRGYLLTGDSAYLAPYQGARDEVERELDLISAGAESAAQRAEAVQLQALTLRKLDELSQTISLRRSGRIGESLAIVRSDAGRQIMDQIRSVLANADARESATLVDRLAASDRAGARLRLVILLAGLLITGIGVLLVVTVRRAMQELRASRDAAQAANTRLLAEIGGREEAEARMRQMQKMEAIGQLTGGVAHDFNNMLAVIIGALQLAQRRLQRGESDVGRYLESAMDGARRAATLTSRLLAFARRQPLSPAVLDVNRVVTGMAEMLRRTLGEQVEFETALAGGLWRVNIDASELENAILNICVNARDAMGANGKLTIETGNAHLDEAYAAANADVTPGQYVLVAISDNGQGMSAETQAKAFEPFFTTKQIGKGTGLGLSHVHGFLKQSGGHVAIYSEPGHGTTLKLYMPRTQAAEEPARHIAPAADIMPEGDPAIIILVVEDDERVRAISVGALRELGYTVLHAATGPAALETLDANPSVNLLFTDIVMPDMSGRVLSDEALRRWPSLKVLYTTGYTQNAIVHNGIVDADARLLLKPYSLGDLAQKIRAVLNEK